MKSQKRESSITIAIEMEEEVDSNEMTSLNMSFSKCLVELQLPKKLRYL